MIGPRAPTRMRRRIGIGGNLAAPALSHHRTYGARLRRFGGFSGESGRTRRSRAGAAQGPARGADADATGRGLTWPCSSPRSRRSVPATGASSPRVPGTASAPGSARGRASCLTEAWPALDTQRPRLALQPLSGRRLGFRLVHVAARPLGYPAFRPWGASPALPASRVRGPRLTAAGRLARIAPPAVRVLLDHQPIAQGTPQHVPRVDAGLITHPPGGWRTSRARARSSQGHHPASPVPVRRPAQVHGASSRPHLAAGALALLLACGAANPWRADGTSLALCHAWHTRPR